MWVPRDMFVNPLIMMLSDQCVDIAYYSLKNPIIEDSFCVMLETRVNICHHMQQFSLLGKKEELVCT